MNIRNLIIFLTIIYLIIDFIKKNKRKNKNDPPGPIRLPILGNLHQLTNNPHRGLKLISDKYKNGIFSCYLGDHYSIVINDVSIINEIYIKKFEKFISRPNNPTFTMFSSGYKDLAFANNYNDWKSIRSLVSSGFTKSNLLKSINIYLEDQIELLINNMKKFEKSNEPFYPDKHYMKVSINVICKLLFSLDILPNEDVDKGKMDKISVPIHKICRKLGAGHLDDFVGISSPLFFFSKLKYKSYVKSCTDFICEIYQDHLINLDYENPKDLLDLLIINSKDDENDFKTKVIHTSFDFLLGGSDSTSGIFEWFTLFMINNPECQDKVYKELIKVMGANCKTISYKDREKLPYLNACINETLRLRAEDPLGIPRVAIEDVTITIDNSNKYFIPKGTHIHHNLYAVGMNEDVFKNANCFQPDRWLIDDQDQLKKQFNHLIPFSTGPRVCIGKNLSELEIFVACSNLILNFEFTSFYHSSIPIDDIEDFGITIHPKPFAVKLKQRIDNNNK